MEYKGGFQRKEYSEKEFESLIKTVEEKKLSTEAQLAFNKDTNRFFLIVDKGYCEIYDDVEQQPQLYLGRTAHISVNDGQDPTLAKVAYEKYKERVGVTDKPLFYIKDDKVNQNMIYLNKTVEFSIVGASKVIPKTNSQMEYAGVLKVKSDIFSELEKEDILCPKDYQHHITIQEMRRKEHPSLNESVKLINVIENDDLNYIIFPTPKDTQVDNFSNKHPGNLKLWSRTPELEVLTEKNKVNASNVYRH